MFFFFIIIDVNEFINQSGWFSYPGMPHSKEALHHVLAKKCRMGYDKFLECKAAVYMFDYTNGEKVRQGLGARAKAMVFRAARFS